MVVVARSVPDAAAEKAAGRAFGAGVVRKADAALAACSTTGAQLARGRLLLC